MRAEPPYEHGTGLVMYLARYVCGGAIGDRRLVAFDGERVTFVVGREPHDPTTVPAADFVRRLREHIPQPGQRLTRAYGLYASRHRTQALIGALLGAIFGVVFRRRQVCYWLRSSVDERSGGYPRPSTQVEPRWGQGT